MASGQGSRPEGMRTHHPRTRTSDSTSCCARTLVLANFLLAACSGGGGQSYSQHLISIGTGDTYDTYVGYQPLATNKTGNYNSAFGFYPLRLNTTGNVNTAYGVQAL